MISFIANEEYFKEPSGGGNDIYSDLHALKSLGYKVNLLTINELGKLSKIETKETVSIKSLGNDVLFFSGFLSAERLCKIFPIELMENKKIINIKDVHFFRELRSEILLKKKTNHQMVMKRELRIYKACDLVLCYNDKEMVMLQKLLPKTNIQLHTYYDPTFIRNSEFKFNKRLVFAGNFNHIPNLDGVHHLISDLTGFIEDKDLELNIYGPGSIEKLAEYKNLPWLKVHGQVSNRHDIYKDGGIFISPIRFGSGIKIKLIEAALSSMPIIATAESVEGMPLKDSKTIIAYKSNPDIKTEISKLIENQELQKELSENAFKEIKKYSNNRLLQSNLSYFLGEITINNKYF
ncbi:glycosyltransferase family 4 protein [Polynucleobacter paneuropaeus]|nr:glycosyltransferase family 4 protein [Polynucleobacter paneuropaeus]MBT8638557.1 glycosyltransferase family 4 protein [Polynucleobacter paneuropaeus]